MVGHIVTVLILLAININSSITEDEDQEGKIFYVVTELCGVCVVDEPDVFQPTSEWQVVQEGQSIPRGLHVRINLETGVKEAKLMEDSDKDATQSEGNDLVL